MKRWRHLPTVGFDQFRRSAISALEIPSADYSTTLARDTSACGRLREAANPVSVSCSSTLSFRAGFGRPIDIPQATRSPLLLQGIYETQH